MLENYTFFENNISFIIIFNTLFLVMMSIYCIIKIRFYDKIFSKKWSINNIYILIFFMVIVYLAIIFGCFSGSIKTFSLSILLFVILIKSIFNITIKQSIFFALDFMIVPLITNEIVLAFIFFVYKNNIYNISIVQFCTRYSIVFFISSLIIVVLDRKIKSTYWKIFIENQYKLKIVILIQIYIVIFGFSIFLAYESDLKFGEIIFMSLISTMFLYEVLLRYVVRESAIEVFKKDRDLLEEQMKWQLENYNKEKNYISCVKKFRHDFKYFISTLEELLKSNKINDAIVFLEKMNENSERYTSQYKEFSNNKLVQAILNNTYQNALKNKISFEAKVNIPDKISIDELDLCRIFSNIINNAIEATAKIEPEKREIEIYGYTKKECLLLKIINSFNGEIKFEKNKIITSKSNKFEHGLGIEVIEESLNKYGGIMKIEFDKEKFITKIYLPL